MEITRALGRARPHDPSSAPPDRTTVTVLVRQRWLEFAIGGLLAESAWRIDNADESAPAATIVESALWREGLGGRVIVMVPTSTPLACRFAVQRILRGQATGVVTGDTFDELIDALQFTEAGRIYLTASVITRALEVTPLGDRQASVLCALLAGESVETIASAGCLSVATIKRTISELLALHDLRSRSALLQRATDLGYVGRPTASPLP